jgi:hypothetical protein
MSEDQDNELNAAEAKRREALKKLAVFGAYTAPFMLGTLTATKAVAASGGGPSCPPSGCRPGGCCWVNSHLASGLPVGEAVVGSPLKMMHPDGSGTYDGAVQRIRLHPQQPCVRFETVSGITLTLSESTPIAVLRDAGVEYLIAVDVIDGDVLPVEDDAGFRWEALARIDDRGDLPVSLLTANDGVYAAGDVQGRMIYTHNVFKF